MMKGLSHEQFPLIERPSAPVCHGAAHDDSPRKDVRMTTAHGSHVSDYMHRQLEVVPQDTSVVTVATRMRTQHRLGVNRIFRPPSQRLPDCGAS